TRWPTPTAASRSSPSASTSNPGSKVGAWTACGPRRSANGGGSTRLWVAPPTPSTPHSRSRASPTTCVASWAPTTGKIRYSRVSKKAIATTATAELLRQNRRRPRGLAELATVRRDCPRPLAGPPALREAPLPGARLPLLAAGRGVLRRPRPRVPAARRQEPQPLAGPPPRARPRGGLDRRGLEGRRALRRARGRRAGGCPLPAER